MGDRRELRAIAMLVLLLGIVSATTITSCGGGGGSGDTNGDLCEQCGDSDGPCNTRDAVVFPSDHLPKFCEGKPTCDAVLRCARKVDSGQRRCYPANPTTQELDLRYECDGSRPQPLPTPTPIPSPVPSKTVVAATLTPTPVNTGPTATAATPTGTAATQTPTPTTTATPEPEDHVVTITISTADGNDNDLPSTVDATVTYPPAKGAFTNGTAVACTTDEVDGTVTAAQDNGNGTLTFRFSGDNTDVTSIEIDCTFHQRAGQELLDEDLDGSTPAGDVVEFTVA